MTPTIAAQLTAEGHRSARCGHVPVDTVRHIREPHRVLRDWRPTHPRHIPGWLTMAELARRLRSPATGSSGVSATG